MYIMKIQGGLGNQMFEYALARAYEIKHNVLIKYDIDSFKIYTYLTFGLPFFNTKINLATTEESMYFGVFHKRRGLLGRIYNPFFANPNKYIEEYTFHYLKDYVVFRPEAYFDGWWQSYKYFEEVEDTIRQELTLKEPLRERYNAIVSKMQSTNSVVIHIRRGDYAHKESTNKHHGLTSREYYDYCIKEIVTKIPDAHFFVFSDEIQWAKENFKLNHPVEYVDIPDTTPHEELVAMSKAKHFIIANSTFSWWAAWLSNHQDKIVYAPKKWFNKGWNTEDLTPPNWHRI